MADDVPLTLVLADGSRVHCGEILRSLSGKRLVCSGQRDGQAVVVKRYLDPRRAAVHARRETDGLAAFKRAGIAAPEVLYAGNDQEGQPVVVLARIEPAVSLRELLDEDRCDDRLMTQMLELLAAQHAAGIRQTDLHLGNFLLAGGRIVSLDGADVESQVQALDEGQSLNNLALFFSQFPPDRDTAAVALAAHYARLRGWPPATVGERLPALIDAARDERWRERSDKLFRDCTAITHRRDAAQETFVVRAHQAELAPLLADIDASCPADPGLLLKNGNTATVWRTGLGARSIVIKRYNVKSRWHGVQLALKESRARVSWRNAHMLRLFGVDTPAPLACVVRRDRPLRPVAYFIAEAVDGVSLRDWVAQQPGDGEALRGVARQLAVLLARLKHLRISHGDMKASNFLLVDGRLVLIDLDAMHRHRGADGFGRAWRRDMQRLAANWRERPEVQALMTAELRAAGVL